MCRALRSWRPCEISSLAHEFTGAEIPCCSPSELSKWTLRLRCPRATAHFFVKLLRKILWRLGRFLLLLYMALAVFGWVASERLIFRPQPASYRADLLGLLTLPAADGTPLAVLHLPNPAARHTLFYFHGNAEDLGDSEPLLRQWHDAGFAVLAFDYRGYGRSGGKASEQNTYADTRAVLAFAQRQLGVVPERVVVVGRSVGSGPAVELAAREPVASLVLISPFTSAFRVMTRVKLLPFDRFDNLAKIARVRVPILIFHGMADEVIPFAHGPKLLAATMSPAEGEWIADAGHNDIFDVAGDNIVRRMVRFAGALPVRP
jgi:pimeloyl-ACP methyl ester carboxylesterase